MAQCAQQPPTSPAEEEQLSRSSLGPPEIGRAAAPDVGNRGRAHRELADAEADQQVAARGSPASSPQTAVQMPRAFPAAVVRRISSRTAGSSASEICATPLVPAIGGHRVHREIVGADREEIDLAGKAIGQEHAPRAPRSVAPSVRRSGTFRPMAARPTRARSAAARPARSSSTLVTIGEQHADG